MAACSPTVHFLLDGLRVTRNWVEDGVRLMESDPEDIKVRSAYNLSAMSFTPEEIAERIQKHIPDFTIDYEPDFRQAIADSWPSSINDEKAQTDWGWKADFDLEKTTVEMLTQLKR